MLRGQEIVSSVVPGSNSIFDFQKAYRLTEEKVRLSFCLSVSPSGEDGVVSPTGIQATTGDTLGHLTLSFKANDSLT